MLNQETDVKQSIRGWLLDLQPADQRDTSTISDDTPIIEEKYLSSMQVMDLILFVESLRDGPINPAAIQPGSFKSINCIYDAFFSDQKASGQPS